MELCRRLQSAASGDLLLHFFHEHVGFPGRLIKLECQGCVVGKVSLPIDTYKRSASCGVAFGHIQSAYGVCTI